MKPGDPPDDPPVDTGGSPVLPSTTRALASARALPVTAGSTDSTTHSYSVGSVQNRTHADRIGVSSSAIGTSR